LSRHQARTDSLTGLGNRLKLLRDLDVVLSDDHGPRPHVLLLFDLDGFKHYNDSYGHPAGDALLHQLGTQLQATVVGEAMAYRMGGDEFCVLAPWASDRPVDDLVDRTRMALSTHGDGFKIGASCGYARIPVDAVEASEALRIADRGLYAEKNSGRISALAQSKSVLRQVSAVGVNQNVGVDRDHRGTCVVNEPLSFAFSSQEAGVTPSTSPSPSTTVNLKGGGAVSSES